MLAKLACTLALALTATPALANVTASSDAGFVVRQIADVTASAEESWAQLIKPAGWWNGKYTFSGDAANLSLDAMAAACFCEVLPSKISPRSAPRGSVEHMRIVNADEPRVLRMSGGLGALQGEAVQGTLTIALKPIDGGGTRILWEYVVGGYMREKPDQMAPLVDAMLGEQLARLAAKLGAKAPAPAPEVPADPAPPPPRKPVEGR